MIKFQDRTQKAIAITEVQLRIAELQLLRGKLKEKEEGIDRMREVERIANVASFSMSIEALEQTLVILRLIDVEH